MSKKNVIMVVGGETCDETIINTINSNPDCYIVGVDRGAEVIDRLGIEADMVIGDFDSLGEIPSHPNVKKLPVKKDDTDIISSVRTALGMGAETICIYGAAGGNRFDHTIANIQTLQFIAENNAVGFIIDKDFIMCSFKNKTLVFDETFKGTFSLFSLCGKAEGVNIRGLSYEAENIVLTPDFPLGVSNSFKGETAEISVKNGVLTAIWYENRFPDIK